MRKIVAIAALLASGALLNGCYYPDPTYGMYAPGGALADKNEGPMLLASADESTIQSLFPPGTSRDRVIQSLGAPKTASSNSDGTTVHIYTHTFTSYQRKFVQVESLAVTYNPDNKVRSTSLTKATNNW